MLKLGVNIDHIATLRNARGGIDPDPVNAAVVCELYGADCITIHTREDKRHIRFEDAVLIRKIIKTKLNLEMAPIPEMVTFATELHPDEVCLVPEKRNEITTEGGLCISKNIKEIEKVIEKLKAAGIVVSVFIDPDETEIESARLCRSDFIELHTGQYANANENNVSLELNRLKRSAAFARELDLRVNAGHGLNYKNVSEVAKIKEIQVLNIGHSIISRAIFVGLGNAVKEMKNLILSARQV